MRQRIALPLIALVVSLLGALVVVATPTAYAGDPAELTGVPPQLRTSPAGDPPGANDWDCKPTAKSPTPVVLVHGTGGDRKNLLERLSRSIKRKGFCVYSLDYGNRGPEDIRDSAKQLKRYTRRVLRATGAKQVSMVGHSQGGMMPRYYIKFLGGKKKVDDLIGVAPSNHGTAVTGGDNRSVKCSETWCTCRVGPACSRTPPRLSWPISTRGTRRPAR